MARSHDSYYDAPEEPEYTPVEELVVWVDKLLDYRRRNSPSNFQFEKCEDFLNNLKRIRDEMRADDLPDYDDPIATEPATSHASEWVDDTERKALEEATGNG